jgi:uncharacterized phage protein (TIGR01671 family)
MMNRVLKFRAWDKLNKSFIYSDQSYQGHYVLTLDGKFYNLQNGSGGHEYIVQQFTGLKDRKGNEIYEGDIIKAGSRNEGYLEYECQYSKEKAAFILKYEYSFIYLPDFDTLEVIGNIFEK